MDYSRDIAVVRFQTCAHSLFGILFPGLMMMMLMYYSVAEFAVKVIK